MFVLVGGHGRAVGEGLCFELRAPHAAVLFDGVWARSAGGVACVLPVGASEDGWLLWGCGVLPEPTLQSDLVVVDLCAFHFLAFRQCWFFEVFC